MAYKYNYQKEIDEKKSARVMKKNLPISVKYATEFGNYFRNMPLDKAIVILENIEAKKDHLPLVKYSKKVAHRKGDAKRGVKAGRFPIKAAYYMRLLLEEVRANAENKNLDIERLNIKSIFATKGVTRTKSQPLGKVGGKMRESKSTNVEVIVLEE